MKNLQDKLAASIKPARSKSPAKTKSPAADASTAAGEQNQAQAPAQASANPPKEQQQPATEKDLQAPQQGKGTPGAAGTDLKGQTQPLHPERVWPD